jgi:iron complex outermembrane recepter protein
MQAAMDTKRHLITAFAWLLVCSAAAREETQLQSMSIDDLMKMTVTSATKREQSLDSTAEAITVITQDDIQRSGARTLVDALRLVPGLQIGRYTQNYYGVTARGFNSPNFDGSNGNKLLVLMDGRSLYMPYTSSVYWEIEDTLLEDIDRIEVIRGPGGSLYGANAVNGVINIITKIANATQGGLVVSSAGTLQRDRLAVRYGWKEGDHAAFRVFGKVGNDNGSVDLSGSQVGDKKNLHEVGFRGDIDLNTRGSLMVQGAFNSFRINEAISQPSLSDPFSFFANNPDVIQTGDLLGLWTLDGINGEKTKLQVYYDLLNYPFTNATGISNTFDVDFLHQLAPAKIGNVIVGAGYRYMINDSVPGPTQQLMPKTRHDTIYSLLAQDQIPIGCRDTFTAGFKLEHNDYTGYEFEPSVRFLHKLDSNHALWGAISRAIRTPSQTESSDVVVTSVDPPDAQNPLPTAHTSFGNPNLTSERLIAYELGCRIKTSDRFSLDLAAFEDKYSNLIYSVAGAPFNGVEFGVPVTVSPTSLQNGETGDVLGAELLARCKLSNRSFATLGATYVAPKSFSQGSTIETPRYQYFGRLSQDMLKDLKLDVIYYWYGSVDDVNQAATSKLDAHLAWNVRPGVELSAGGQDLLFKRAIQFPGGSAIPRSAYVQLSARF